MVVLNFIINEIFGQGAIFLALDVYKRQHGAFGVQLF